MKKYLICLFAFICGRNEATPREIFARSFMFTRPASFNIAQDVQLWHNFVYSKNGPLLSAIQAIGFYQESIKRSKTARYFLFEDQDALTVSGDANEDQFFTRDIRAEWLDLPATFTGTFTISPEQKQSGFKLFYNQDLKELFGIPFLKDWSVGIEMPVIWVENNINFTTCDTVCTTSYGMPNLCEAFNNPEWCYAKIPCCSLKKNRPANIKLTLGRDFPLDGYFQMATYMSLEIPIGKHQDPEFMFSPVVGNDQHVGIGGAMLMQVQLNKDPEYFAWSFFLDIEGLFLIRNHQMRTYDLKGKPWSRYMQFVRRNSTPGDTIPGVNVLTLESIVRPFGIADFSMGWRFNWSIVEAEIGYDIWGHGGETVRLRYPPVISSNNRPCGGLNEFGIAGSGVSIVEGRAVAATASASTISNQAADDIGFVGITENDLDFCTPAAGSALNQKVHAAIGIQQQGDSYGYFVGIGGFGEFAYKNSPLSTWGVWGKLGLSF